MHKSGFNEARALISQTMLECYLRSRAKNLSGSRAPIDNYVLKGGYSNLHWGGKAVQEGRVAIRGTNAISIGSSGLSKCVVLCACVKVYMHMCCNTTILSFLKYVYSS